MQQLEGFFVGARLVEHVQHVVHAFLVAIEEFAAEAEAVVQGESLAEVNQLRTLDGIVERGLGV